MTGDSTRIRDSAGPGAIGSLFLIGGHEDKDGNPEILRRFVAASGGSKAQISILTCASKEPDEAGRKYAQLFEELGVSRVRVVRTNDGSCAQDDEVVRTIEQATGAFFVGGEPSRIIAAIKDTPLEKSLRESFDNGLVLAGTSAGALAMPEIVIMDGESETHPRADMVKSGPGLGYLKNVILDVHFAERGRTGQMLSALFEFPPCVGLGIDEDTAIVIHDGHFEVVGHGAVFIFESSGTEFENLTVLGCNDLALTGVRLSVLPAGWRFTIVDGKVKHPEKVP